MRVNSGLSEVVTNDVISCLDSVISNLNVLFFMTLNFHWNMEDPRFITLHELLDRQYHDLVEHIDAIAERYRKLGRHVHATMREFLERAELKEPEDFPSGDEMLTDLAEAHEYMIKTVRSAVEKTAELGDPGTSDMLTAQLRWHEKQAWFIRSHL